MSKIQTLTEAISKAIVQEELRVGDNLLSINEASNQYKVSRDTVFKSYSELKRRGLIDSNPMKGYFVKGEVNQVLLLLDTYSPFKQNLYNRFVENLPDNYKVDLIFHQYNEHLFETIIRENVGRYSMYVVMNFSDTRFSESLKVIPSSKLLLLDFGNFEKNGYSFICQNFNESFYNCLYSFKEKFKKYKSFVLVFPEEISHPISSIDWFIRFCNEESYNYNVIRRKADWQGVKKDSLYLCIQTEDMVRIIKEADAASLVLGSDLGLIAYNENPILEVIKNGITSISIDFGLLGEKAARFVRTKEPIQEYLPTELVMRTSI
jgi:DNA-binding transcriptional regulator YhcF (GntR family)